MTHQALKIGLVCDHFLPQKGGIELHVNDLAHQLSQRGHEVQVLTTMPEFNSERANSNGFKIRRLQASLLPKGNIIWNSNALKTIGNILKAENFDLIHCHHSIVSPLAYGSAYITRKLRIPTILTNHSLYSLGSQNFFRWVRLWTNVGQWPFVFSAVSGEAAERTSKALGGIPVEVLPNGFAPEYWKTLRPSIPPLRITTAMRLHRKKFPQDLIKSIAQINVQMPQDQKVRLTFLGEGPMRQSLEKLSSALKVASQVEFLGWQTRSQIKSILQNTAAFAIPSPWESFAITALEACGAGVPVVARLQGGTKDIIQSGQNGYLAKDRIEFTEHLLRILKNPDLQKQLAQNAIQSVQKFSWQSVIDRHLELYQKTIGKMHAHRRAYH